MRLRFACLILPAALVIGCGKSDKSPPVSSTPAYSPIEAVTPAGITGTPAQGGDADRIRQAVVDHVRNDRGINMSAMDMSFDAININGDQANASVTFRVKQGGTSMAMMYSLERHGNGWLVTTAKPSDGQFVHPPMDKTHAPPSPGGSSPAMPDVHEFLKNHPAAN